MKDLSPENLIASIRKSINDSFAAIDSGGYIDMHSTTTEVGILCDAIAMMPPSESNNYEAVLKELIEDFTKLTSKLEESRIEIGAKINTSSVAKMAHKAYNSANNSSQNKSGENK